LASLFSFLSCRSEPATKKAPTQETGAKGRNHRDLLLNAAFLRPVLARHGAPLQSWTAGLACGSLAGNGEVAMRSLKNIVLCACIVVTGCMPQVAAQEPDNSSNLYPSISAAMTCTELRPLLQSRDKVGGLAILWLDGYYSGRAGLPALPPGWTRTVSQGVGGTCAISVNASRPVLDVIAQLHREYSAAGH